MSRTEIIQSIIENNKRDEDKKRNFTSAECL